MNKNLVGVIDKLIAGILFIVAGITPLIFFTGVTEFFEIPKLIFLVITTTILLGLWVFSWVLKGKIEINKTPLDIPLLILAVVIIASALFSASKYPAIFGNLPKVHGSAISWITYILLYFVTVSNLKSLKIIKTFLFFIFGGALITATIGILSFFNIYLPLGLSNSANLTLTGSTFSSLALLLILFPISLISLIKSNKFIPIPLALISSIIFGICIALTGSIPYYIILLIISALSLIYAARNKSLGSDSYLFFIPLTISVIALLFVYLPLPGNAVHQKHLNFPQEIQLPLSISWKISASTFRDSPYLGTGPATYLFNFTSYKPLEYNNLEYWNFSFDAAANEFLQILATLGVVGLLTFIIFCVIVLGNARYNLARLNIHESEDNQALVAGLALSSITAVLLFFTHATTLISLTSTILIIAAFMMSQKNIRERKIQFSTVNKNSDANTRFDLLPMIIFAVFLVGAVPVAYFTYKSALADYYHRQSLVQANVNGNKTYELLQNAEELNPYIDLYRIDMAQTNFALASALASQKGPTEDNPEGTLTDQEKQTIQTLISQAINEGRVAVTLSPLSSRNWEVLASIYRNITGIAQNANTFALDSYGRAIQRDPLNPSLRLSVGGVYYSQKNYDLAIRFYTDAANLKPDYANAFFNLAIALRDKGDLTNAKLVADQTVNLLSKNQNSNDFKLALALRDEINQKISENGTSETNEDEDNTNAIENADVNISGLNNPPDVSTPSAIRQNPNSNLPNITESDND